MVVVRLQNTAMIAYFYNEGARQILVVFLGVYDIDTGAIHISKGFA